MATTIKLFAIVLVADALTTPASAFDVRPNPGITGGSLRIDGHDLTATCGHAKVHRGSMSHALRDEILTRYGLLPGAHPDYEIDHLIPLCLGGSDDPSNLWAQPRRSIERNGTPTITNTTKRIDRAVGRGCTSRSRMDRTMANVYIEPRPKGRREGAPINDYVVEDHADLAALKTQQEAIDWARRHDHTPLVARVRHLNDKKKPDDWRSA